jgi:hypothetical protein
METYDRRDIVIDVIDRLSSSRSHSSVAIFSSDIYYDFSTPIFRQFTEGIMSIELEW